MKYRIVGALLLWGCCALTFAQPCLLRGKVTNKQEKTPVEFASVALLRADSSIVQRGMTDDQGAFLLKIAAPGTYLLKTALVGYRTDYRKVVVNSSSQRVEDILLAHSEQLLSAATVTATAAKMEQVEDTTLFNASAYRVPEGAALEALVKQLPGVEIEEDGTITWNGKVVKEFLINGKDFFKGQADVALQNLPADWVSRIKAYEKKSEYTEQTGIDDGEEQPVLDITMKKELNQAWIARANAGYGTEERYTGKLFLSHSTERSRVSLYGSANNVADQSFGGKKRRNGGGLTERENAGLDFNWENKRGKREAGRLELGGNFNYNHVHTALATRVQSENFVAGGARSSYRSSVGAQQSSATFWDARFRLEWHPDTMTTIQFRPAFRRQTAHHGGSGRTATFNDDPFALPGMVSPLDSLWADDHSAELDSMAVNRNVRSNLGDRESRQANGSLTLVRRLSAEGRNLSLALSGGYASNEQHNFSISDIQYYNGMENKYLNQYSHMPSHNWNYRVQVGYVEPVARNWFVEMRYAFSGRYTDSDRSRYQLDRIDSIYGDWGDGGNCPPIGTLPEEEILAAVRDSVNSRYATYRYYNHLAHLGFRYTSLSVRLSAGVGLHPERTQMSYERPCQLLDTLVERHILRVAPQLNFRYRIDKQHRIDARYRGTSSQPSMMDMLAVVDNSNPLNVTMGNPGLKPSWSNVFEIGYQGYEKERQQGVGLGFNFTQTRNAVSRLSVYDEETGIRYHRPQNINGNWHMQGNATFNTGLGKEKNFTLATRTHLSYNKSVGYVSSLSGSNGATDIPEGSFDVEDYEPVFSQAEIERNTARTWGLRERLNLAYRKHWLELGVFGQFKYIHSRSDIRVRNNRDTWDYAYGIKTNLDFDNGFSLATDLRVSSRRGYPNATMNTDEWLWNLQVAYSFLKKKVATVSLQCLDLLQQQSNVSHSISATHRSDSWNNSIHSYCMLHLIYKFRSISGKNRERR